MLRAVPLVLICCAFALAPRSALAGEFAAAVTRGDLAGAERLRHVGEARADDAEEAALCRLLTFENRLSEAVECLGAEAARRPDQTAISAALAGVEMRRGDFKRASADYARAGRAARAAEAEALSRGSAYRIRSDRKVYVAPFVRRDPLPLLSVRLDDGRDHLFVLDTGAGETVLDPKVAEALGVAPLAGGATGVFAGGKTAEVRYGVLPRLQLGALVIERTPVLLLSTQAFAQALGGTVVDGVIGIDLLRRFTATIDYPRSRLVLSTTSVADESARSFRFWLAGDHYLLAQGAIDGAPQLTLVDTGLAGQGCTVPASTLAAIGEKVSGPTGFGVGGGGAVAAAPFVAASVELGPVTAKAVPCLAGPFPPSLETSTGARIGLLVSHEFLKPYAVTIDFRTMRMSLR
jgi:hypothetical protein